MQREPARRGFTVSHQKVVVELNFAGSLRGYTEITIVPVTSELKTVHLHSRQCTIHGVKIQKTDTDFVYRDPLASITASKANDVHIFPEIQRKIYSALSESDEGELSIAIPDELAPMHKANIVPLHHQFDTPEPARMGTPSSEFAPLTITIEYSLTNPLDGLQFVLPTEAYPYRVPHIYTTPSSHDAARCWVPCVDSLWERCTWEFEIVVPRFLGARDSDPDSMDVDNMDNDPPFPPSSQRQYPVVVVCSGELVEQVAHPTSSSKTIFLYNQTLPTSVQHIAFAAGPFHIHTLPFQRSDVSDAPSDNPSAQPTMHAFCLPGLEASLAASVSFIRSAMWFYSSEFGSYPFGSHKLVFVDELPAERFDSATLSLVRAEFLHGDDAIEQVFETRQLLSHALACQWIGINIVQKTWADTWVVNGLGLYITGLFIRRIFGNNEYRFRLRKDMDRVAAMDIGSLPPICQPSHLEPPDGSVLPFINLKAPLVLYILDRRLGKSGTSLGLSRVLPKIFLSAISGEMSNNALSTASFLRTCRKVSGIDVRSFAEQWIFGSGCPRFSFQASFNRKKMAVELMMQQECPAYVSAEGDPIALSLFKPAPFFEGQMTVRIHEADGTPYEHVLDIRNPYKKFDVPFNTKYKRVRRNTKRYLARQAAAARAAEGEGDAAEAFDIIDSGFELPLWEEESERTQWRVSDWTEEDEQKMNGATYEWIRLDADFEWIAFITFDQPDFMWVSQLQRDKDVVAQLEAIRALSRTPSPIISSMLTKTVLVSNYFFRVRCEAVTALLRCAQGALGVGLHQLYKLYTRYCYEPQGRGDPLEAKFVPKPNDFSDFAEYFVRKTIITAVSRHRDAEGKPADILRPFLLDQLRYNDNSVNPYSDSLYICTVIAALGYALLPPNVLERSELSSAQWAPEMSDQDRVFLEMSVAEVDRFRELDKVIPSYHNVISIAVLEWYSMLISANILPNDFRLFLAYSREGNFTPVRVAAFEGLLLRKWIGAKTMHRYILAVCANDPSRIVRREVARGIVESVAILEAVGDLRTPGKEGDKPVMIEDDMSQQPNKQKQSKRGEVENFVRTLRKGVGCYSGIRDAVIPMLLNNELDMEVRWCILKWADLIFRPAEEELPKLKMALKIAPKFHTPVPETPVQPSPAPLPAPLPAVPKAGPKAPPKPRAPKQPKAARAPKAPKVIAPAQKPTQPPSRNTPLPSSQPAIAPAPKLEPTPPPSLAAVDDLLAEEIEAIEAESSQSKSSPKKKAKPKAHTSDLPTPTPPPSQQHTLAVPDAPVPATTPSKINLGPKKNKKHTEEAIDVTPVAQPKPTGPVGKNKKAVVEGVIDRPVTPSSASKGKGKATNGSSPATKTLVDIKKCKEILNIIRKAEGAWLFWYPVDIVAAGCPTYYDEIKNPIDMQTMETKLDDGSYKSMEQFKADFELMFRNCRQFNPPGTDPYVVADLVEKAFKKEWAKIAQKKMAPGDRRSLQALLNKIKSDETSFWFRVPVNPELLNIPDYYDVVPQKDARDLGTIKQKLDADKYDSVEAVEDDVKLMVSNAVKFNGPQSDVGLQAVETGRLFNVGVVQMRNAHLKKRKDEGGGSASTVPAKKARHS